MISFIEVSGHGLQTTTATNLTSGAPQGDQYWTAADHDFFQSDEFAQFEDTVYSPPNRYVTQSRSSNGKLAYVVFAGHDIGVFYNWYVDCQYHNLTILSNYDHYRAACSAATSGFSNKVYKGFGSYNEAHSVWHDFANRNVLPPDVLIGLNGRPAPLPPTVSQPNIGGLADPPFKSPLQAPATIGSPRRPIVTPFFNCSQAEEAFKMPSALCTRSPAHDGLTLKIEATLPAATQNLVGSRKASDAEDFWVVLTGTSPGVYKGR